MSDPTNIYYTIAGTDYTFPFAYLSASHVKATIDGVAATYELIAQNTIRIVSTGNVGKTLRIYRDTPRTAIHTWEDGAVILGSHMNAANTQSVYVAEEAMGYAEGIAEEAKQFALDGLAGAIDTALDAAKVELAASIAPQVTAAESAKTGAESARNTAETHKNAAQAAVAEAEAAVEGVPAAAEAAVEGVVADAIADVQTTLQSYVTTAAGHVATTEANKTATAASASAAAGSATTASGHKDAAAASATAAATSASGVSAALATIPDLAADAAEEAVSGYVEDAENHADDAQATLDEFLKRFLGAFAANPTVDLKGNALQTGALYFNTTAHEMRVWDGSSWGAAYIPGSSSVASFNGRTGAVTPTTGDYAVAHITGLQTALDAKAAAADLADKADADDVTLALAGKANTSHTQAISTITGLQSALDAKAASSDVTTALAAKANASDVTTALAGKADTSHTQAISTITGLQSALDAKAASSDVTTALAGKSNTGHGHATSDITGLDAALAAKADASSVSGKVDSTRSVATSGLATGGGNLSADRTITVPKAAASDLRTGTDDTKALTPKAAYDAVAPVALTDASTIAFDFATGNHMYVTLGGNRGMGAGSNIKPGQSGTIRIAQDATGSRTLTFNSVWKFAGGTAPSLTTTANAVDVLSYYAYSSTWIYASLAKDVK
jgi:hypothetical protein